MTVIKGPGRTKSPKPEVPTRPGLYIDVDGNLWRLARDIYTGETHWHCVSDGDTPSVFSYHTMRSSYLPMRRCEYLEYR